MTSYFLFNNIEFSSNIRSCKVLIAVNNNAAAPIMEQADYAVEADLRTFLPAFIEQVKKIKKSR